MNNNNDNREVLEAISELSQHVDKQVGGVREEMGKMKVDLQGEIGKLRSDLINHVTRTIANIPSAAKDQRIDKVVHKLKERNIFNAADVLETLAHVPQV